mmetsp:Transcript_23423/g.55460  ORF Transcript_23423/g.55460 Transcript_23423/m.55460 type:complete len:253 (+) Transcript_23423:101-859(+)
MPKVKRNSNLIRLTRRRIATSDNLSSSLPRKFNKQDGVAVQMKESKVKTPLEKETARLSEKANVNQENDNVSLPRKGGGNRDKDNRQMELLSRGQRRRQAKREQFLRKEKMILSSLILQQNNEQKKRIDGLDAIKKALMETEDTDRSCQISKTDTKKPELHHISTIKAKRKLVANEIEHVNLILQHPSFQKNPFATMQEHLRNSFSEDRKYQESLSKKRTETERQKTEAKRAEKNQIKKKSQKKKYKPRRTR